MMMMMMMIIIIIIIIIKIYLKPILRTRCVRFQVQFGMCPILRPKKHFQIIHYCDLCLHIVSYYCRKFQRNLRADSEKKVHRFLGPVQDKIFHFGAKRAFICHLCLLIVLNHHAKISKKILNVDSENKGYKLLGPN